MPDLPDGIPRVDELFSRAVVAQLAEQRAQRETFAEVERKLEGLERLVSDRLSDLSKLLRSGEVELRLEVLEEELGQRLGRLESALKGDLGRRVETLEQLVGDRIGRMEEAIRADDVARHLSALELAMTERMAHLEERLMSRPAEAVGPRLEGLESALGERMGHLEESVRSEEIGRRLKALELAVEERSSRLEEFVRTADVERRLETLQQAVDERLESLRAALGAAERDERIEALDQAVGDRLSRLEGSFRRLEEQTAARLEDLRMATTAAEVGILERIIAESQVVGAHFEAVRPVMEAAGPGLGDALAELRRLAADARASAQAAGDAGPYSEATIQLPASDEGEDTVFLPPEETPIPDRRFGGIIPRRER